jgi:hypothetical protein
MVGRKPSKIAGFGAKEFETYSPQTASYLQAMRLMQGFQEAVCVRFWFWFRLCCYPF